MLRAESSLATHSRISRPRPAYQAPETVETQAELDLDVRLSGDGAPAEPLDWPSDLKTRAQACAPS
jgi:hypothetical protein